MKGDSSSEGQQGHWSFCSPLRDSPDMQIMQWNWTSAWSEKQAKQNCRNGNEREAKPCHHFGTTQPGSMHRLRIVLHLRCIYVFMTCLWWNKSGKKLLDVFYVSFQLLHHRIFHKKKRKWIPWKIFIAPMWFQKGCRPYMKILIWQTKGYSNSHSPKYIA